MVRLYVAIDSPLQSQWLYGVIDASGPVIFGYGTMFSKGGLIVWFEDMDPGVYGLRSQLGTFAAEHELRFVRTPHSL